MHENCITQIKPGTKRTHAHKKINLNLGLGNEEKCAPKARKIMVQFFCVFLQLQTTDLLSIFSFVSTNTFLSCNNLRKRFFSASLNPIALLKATIDNTASYVISKPA